MNGSGNFGATMGKGMKKKKMPKPAIKKMKLKMAGKKKDGDEAMLKKKML